jgi:putative permease
MLQQLNNIFRKIFPTEESLAFALLLLISIFILAVLGSTLSPFIVSVIFAYLLIGLNNRIVNFGLGERLSLFITFSIFMLAGLALLIWLAPILYQQLQSIITELPKWFSQLRTFISDLPNQYPDLVTSDQIASFLDNVSAQLLVVSQNFLRISILGIQNTLSLAVMLVLLPILVYFMLFDRKELINSFLTILPNNKNMLEKIWAEMDVQLSNYVRGKAFEILIVGIASAILFWSFGLKYTALLSVLVGLSVLIPYIGAFAVTVPVAVVAYLQFGFGYDFMLLLGLYIVLQVIDGNWLVPMLFSNAVKMHPVTIILAVFVFGGLFGFWGVFFAIPMATFFKAIVNAWPSESSG